MQSCAALYYGKFRMADLETAFKWEPEMGSDAATAYRTVTPPTGALRLGASVPAGGSATSPRHRPNGD